MLKALRLGRTTKEWLGAAFIAVLIFQAVYLPQRIGKRADVITASVGDRLAKKDEQIDNLLKLLTSYTEDEKKSMVRVDSIIKSGAEIMHYMRWQILPEVKTTISAANAVVESMGRDLPAITANVNKLLTSSDQDAKKVGVLLDSVNTEVLKIQTLTTDLDKEIAEGSDKAGKTITDLDTAIKHLDGILNGDDLKGILANSNAGTKSLAGSLESVNQALMPLRKKLSLLRIIFNKIVSVGTAIAVKW